MSSFIIAIILGAVEGLTEFLPVSSTGHLIILNKWLSFDPSFTHAFDIFIQLGAILAVLVYFRHKLWPLRRREGRLAVDASTIAIWKKAIAAVIPALVVGAAFGSAIEDKLFSPLVVAIALIVGGVVLIVSEVVSKREARIASVPEIGYGKAIAIGCIQCLAFIPGTSRSASTIIGALFLGASRETAAEFSFFLAIPTMAAASGYALLKQGLSFTGREAALLAVGFVVAFLVAWAVIGAFMKYIRKRDFKPFGYYRIALGIAVLLLLL